MHERDAGSSHEKGEFYVYTECYQRADVITMQIEHRQDIMNTVRSKGHARYRPVTGLWYIAERR